MYGLIALSVLVAGASIAWIADGIDDDDVNTNDEEWGVDEPVAVDQEEPDPVEEGQNLLFDGTANLIGTGGDDTLSAGQDEDLAPERVSLLAGDDVATIDVPFGVTVSGGDGDDQLSSFSVGNVLDGGEGNDTLYGIDANNMFGGVGDDDITFDSDVELNSSTARISGDAGDDKITVLADVGVDEPDKGGAIISGGEGADIFEVVMNLENSLVDVNGSGGPLSTRLGRIADFDPSVDMLQIEMETDAESQGRVFTVDMEQSEEDGRYTSLITFTFHKNTNIDAAEAEAVLVVVSNAPFDMNDINIVRA
jgi:hypothetical protein